MHLANRALGALGLFIISYAFLVGPAVASKAVMDCKNIGGQPTAAAPVSKQKIEEYFAKLAKARPHCAVAAMGGLAHLMARHVQANSQKRYLSSLIDQPLEAIDQLEAWLRALFTIPTGFGEVHETLILFACMIKMLTELLCRGWPL